MQTDTHMYLAVLTNLRKIEGSRLVHPPLDADLKKLIFHRLV